MRRGSRLAIVLIVVVTFWLGRASAQGTIPNGVFVRNSEGGIWLVLDGQRVRLPIWQASDEEIAGIPLADRWAVMNDASAIVDGDRPSWLGESTQAVTPSVDSPASTLAAPPSALVPVVIPTPTPTPAPRPVVAPPTRNPAISCGAVASRIVTATRDSNPGMGSLSGPLTLSIREECETVARRDGENGVACFEGAWLTLAPIMGQPGTGGINLRAAANDLYASCMRGR